MTNPLLSLSQSCCHVMALGLPCRSSPWKEANDCFVFVLCRGCQPSCQGQVRRDKEESAVSPRS